MGTFIMIFISIILCFMFPIVGVPLLILCLITEVFHQLGHFITHEICPNCKEEIKSSAKVCKHCGTRFKN